MNEHELYKRVVMRWGKDSQVIMAIEEMAELTKELCNEFRGRTSVERIVDEIADVEIMMGQMRVIFDCGALVEKRKEEKLKRLAGRVE